MGVLDLFKLDGKVALVDGARADVLLFAGGDMTAVKEELEAQKVRSLVFPLLFSVPYRNTKI